MEYIFVIKCYRILMTRIDVNQESDITGKLNSKVGHAPNTI